MDTLPWGEIAARHRNVPKAHLPTPTRYAQFADWVLWDDGAQDDGSLLGHCPIHDAGRSKPGSAEFVFAKGVMRCQGDPSCHPGKRAMSLQNVLTVVRNGVH